MRAAEKGRKLESEGAHWSERLEPMSGSGCGVVSPFSVRHFMRATGFSGDGGR